MATPQQQTPEGDVSPHEPEGDPAKVNVMIAGLPRSGKSTALNNIFDLDLKAKLSAKSVTKAVVETVIKKNDVTLTVIDTPGLRARDVKQRVVLHEMKNIGITKNFLLLMTLPVGHASAMTTDYCNTIKNLTSIFGKKIWDWCFILLTSSDAVRDSDFPSDKDNEDYQRYLKEHCEELQKELAKNGVKKEVQPFFKYKSEEEFKTRSLNEIVAMPVAKNKDVRTERILPCQPWAHKYHWTDIIYMEITKLKDKINPEVSKLRKSLIQLRYGKYVVQEKGTAIAVASAAGAATGMFLGAVAGGGLGAVAGPAGVIIGASVGASVGAVAGGTLVSAGVGSSAAAVALIHNTIIIKRNLKENPEPAT